MRKNIICILLFLFANNLFAQDSLIRKVDKLVEEVIEAFNVPGIAVGIIKDGEVVLAKGYGVQSIRTNKAVTSNTNFGIASNSKAFTAAALAILVDEQKIKWTDPVQKYIPNFKLYDDYVSAHFTITDLLTHRSGLGLGAGDLMIWPDGHNFTPTDIINNLQYLKPVSEFRTKYDYDNLLYIVAGVVVERVSGLTWQSFIEKHFFQPLQMTTSVASLKLLDKDAEVIDAHVPVEDKLIIIEKYANPILDAAGGIYSNINDMSKWVGFLLHEGKHNGEQLLSVQQVKHLQTAHTLMPVNTQAPYYSLFNSYGLGFRLTDVRGKLEVSHTGGLEGTVTQVVMLPQLKLGIIVLTNQQEGAAFSAISNTIKDYYLGIDEQNWLGFYQNLISNRKKDANLMVDQVWEKVTENQSSELDNTLDLEGTFRDNWFGDVVIKKSDGKLTFASQRSPRLSGEILYYQGNSYVVKWNDRYFDADAFLHFKIDNKQIKGFTMLPISPLTDFSYDFQDLDFKKVK